MALDLDPYTHAYTAEEVAHLEMRSRRTDLDINRQLFPENYAVEPELSVAQALNNLPGEFVEGHPVDDYPKNQGGPVHCNGFDDAPDDVKEEIQPLTVEELKAELDAIKVPYEKGAHKSKLRDLLAVAWAAM
jgi:hypothetical protein